jgi:hypothetical protein
MYCDICGMGIIYPQKPLKKVIEYYDGEYHQHICEDCIQNMYNDLDILI